MSPLGRSGRGKRFNTKQRLMRMYCRIVGHRWTEWRQFPDGSCIRSCKRRRCHTMQAGRVTLIWTPEAAK